jgi:hypothetical protein
MLELWYSSTIPDVGTIRRRMVSFTSWLLCPKGNSPCYTLNRSWVCPRIGMDSVKINILPCWELDLGDLAHSPIAHNCSDSYWGPGPSSSVTVVTSSGASCVYKIFHVMKWPHLYTYIWNSWDMVLFCGFHMYHHEVISLMVLLFCVNIQMLKMTYLN